MKIHERILGVAVAAATACTGFRAPPAPRPRRAAAPATALGGAARPKSSSFDREVEELFAQYDVDGNGAIDAREFGAVVTKMRRSARRREVVSVAAAAFGAVFVASGSNTFQFAQKRLRKK